jgi:plasmid stability protein
MAALHVRNLDDAVIAALKQRAARNHRSLQGEVRSILEQVAAGMTDSRSGRRLRLRLRTVRVGRPGAYTRDVIYEDDGDR